MADNDGIPSGAVMPTGEATMSFSSSDGHSSTSPSAALNLPQGVKEGLPESVIRLLPHVDDSELCSSDSFAIQAEVDDIADKWYRFGKALYLTPEKLNLLKTAQRDPKDCLSDSLLEFLKKNYDWEKYGVPSWRLIVIALAHKSGGDDTALALRVAKNHFTSGSPAPASSTPSAASTSCGDVTNITISSNPSNAGVEIEEVWSNIHNLNDKFLALIKAIQNELEKPSDGREPVNVSDTVDRIIRSPTADWDPQEEAILMKNKGLLRDSRDVQGVLDCLGFWDYLNPDIYEVLIGDFSLHSLEGKLAKYREELDKFMEITPVKVFSGIVGSKRRGQKKIPKAFRELVTNHKWQSPVYLKDVEEFRRDVACEYKLRRCAVFVTALGVQSVVVTLLLPYVIQSRLLSTTPEFLLKHAINRMDFNGIAIQGRVLVRAIKHGKEAVSSLLVSGVHPNLNRLRRSPLHEASATGQTEIVTLLLDHGADVHAKDQSRRTPLHLASEGGHVNTVKVLLQRGADPSSHITKRGETPFMLASRHARRDVMGLLIDSGADPNIPYKKKHTRHLSKTVSVFQSERKDPANYGGSLHEASARGQTTTVTLLLDQGAQVDAEDELHRTPLCLACERGHTDTVRVLLQRGADPNKFSHKSGETALLLASRGSRLDIMKLLLNSGADPNIPFKKEYTHPRWSKTTRSLHRHVKGPRHHRGSPLHEASARGQTAAVTLLLEHGAKVDAEDMDGMTPLMLAICPHDKQYMYGHKTPAEGVVKSLIDAGANLNIKDKSGRTALHHAALHGDGIVLNLLLKVPNCPINDQAQDGMTPLMLAICQHDKPYMYGALATEPWLFPEYNIPRPQHKHKTPAESVVKSLIDAGANLNIKDKSSRTALHHAAIHEDGKVLNLLLKVPNCPINDQDQDGTTPLMLAICQHDKSYMYGALATEPWLFPEYNIHKKSLIDVKSLIDAGANLNIKDKSGRTALHHAALHGDGTVLNLLLKVPNCPINDQDQDGTTPLMVAICEHDKPYMYGALATELLPEAESVVKSLIDAGANLNIKDKSGRTALHHAALREDGTVLNLLLKVPNCPINDQDQTGQSALMLAVTKRNLEAARILVEAGADVDIKDEMNRSAIDAAKTRDRSIYRMLLETLTLKEQDPGPQRTGASLASYEGQGYKLPQVPSYYAKDKKYPGIFFFGGQWKRLVTSKGAHITDWGKEIGIEFNIPPGAVPEGKQLELSVWPCISGPFDLPEGYHPASPVYLITSSFEFSRDITVTMYHYSTVEMDDDCKSMAFLSAPATQLTKGQQPQYVFKVLNKGVFNPADKYGSVSLNPFCLTTIGKSSDSKAHSSTQDKNEYAFQVYREQLFHFGVAVFSASLFQPLYFTMLEKVVRKKFPYIKLYSNRVQPVSIIEDKLSLHWQTDREWEIVSDQIPCEISKQVLDNPQFVPYPPLIVLNINCVSGSSEEMSPIEVTVLGIGEDRKFIVNPKPRLTHHPAQIRHEMAALDLPVLDLPARPFIGLPVSVIKDFPQVDDSELQSSRTSSRLRFSSTTGSVLTAPPDLSQIHMIVYRVSNEVKICKAINAIAREWRAIGRELGMKDEFLESQSRHEDNTVAAMNVITFWTRSDEKATWRRLITAMRVGGKLTTEANELEKALLNKV